MHPGDQQNVSDEVFEQSKTRLQDMVSCNRTLKIILAQTVIIKHALLMQQKKLLQEEKRLKKARKRKRMGEVLFMGYFY
jgi:hypothetical protein